MSHAPNAAPQAELEISISPVRETDMGYVLGSWREALKLTPANKRMPWGAFKRAVMPALAAIMASPSTKVIGAYVEDEIVGWAALDLSRRIPTLHWIHTRYHAGGVDWRRRGIAGELLLALKLGPRLVYTHRGPKPRHRTTGDVRTSDEMLVEWLAKRGTYAVHVPYQEWI
jgi:hypothetical protein